MNDFSKMECQFQKRVSIIRLYSAWSLLLFSFSLTAQPFSNNESDWVDLARIDTLLDLSEQVVYHINEPPFSEYNIIAGKSFTYLDPHELNEQWINGLNKRFWLKFKLHNSDSITIKDYKIYLGISDRVFLYKIESNEIIEIAKKGANYRKTANPELPLYFDFPIHLLSGDSAVYLAHLSNAYFPESFESIEPMIIKRGYEEFLYKPSRTANKLGLLYLSTLTIILVFLIIGIALFILLKDRSILAFSLLCFSFLLYYIRDLEKLISSVTFLSVPDEFLSRSEPLARTIITLAFLIFTFTYFKKFKFRRNYKIASFLVISFGIIGGLRSLMFPPLDVLISYTSMDMFLHNGFMISSMILTFLILRTIWYSAEYYSKFYIVGTLVYSIINYGGIIIENIYAHDGAIEHLNKYASITGVLLFTLIIAYMIMQRLIMTEKQVILKTAEVENLNEINRAKSEFYTNVTHEFSPPLTVILGMASSIKKNTVEKNLIIKNAKTLLSLVNQILSLSKNQEHATSLKYVNTDIVNYLKSIIEPLVYHAEQKYLDLVLESKQDEIKMDFDSSAIQKVVNNLIYNAIKFSPPHTTIRLEVSIQEDKLKCVISDEGIGIEADQIPHIFDRFYQADPSFNSKSDIGSGIGLSIVKETIENMKGTITVESVIGEGTRFIIILPIENAEVISIINRGDNTESHSHIQRLQKNINLKAQATILIIEDNEDVMLYTQRCLKTVRYISKTVLNLHLMKI